MMNYCKQTGVTVDGVHLTTPACDLVDIPTSDTDETHNVVTYLAWSLKSRA